jgi:hypothetical protein
MSLCEVKRTSRCGWDEGLVVAGIEVIEKQRGDVFQVVSEK